ncbi:SdpI family protein [Arthrobacter sulfonylureivorans]|uniref:SdpI family protein n=1 Tax=Arthrobacter sulfonylureivorans TaxID=2486855 RepID=A0ABY3WEA1_9MICC|nr:SdpI family protein [Arthrobacter sulfonylureivorans]UNK47801.1 SdpI family protein [Arthrobacter sulfonylureivorans]
MSEEILGRTIMFVVMVGSGILLLRMAHAAASGRLTRNPNAGIRTPATMVNDRAWLTAHQAAKRPTQFAGWCAIASAMPSALPAPLPFAIASILFGAAALLVFVLYGAAVGSRAARSLPSED